VTARLEINIVWDELPMMLLQKTEKKNKTPIHTIHTYITSIQHTSGYYTIPIGMGLRTYIHTLTLKLYLAIAVNTPGFFFTCHVLHL